VEQLSVNQYISFASPNSIDAYKIVNKEWRIYFKYFRAFKRNKICNTELLYVITILFCIYL